MVYVGVRSPIKRSTHLVAKALSYIRSETSLESPPLSPFQVHPLFRDGPGLGSSVHDTVEQEVHRVYSSFPVLEICLVTPVPFYRTLNDLPPFKWVPLLSSIHTILGKSRVRVGFD